MNGKNNEWIWIYLGVALLAAAFAFVLPDAAIADECNTDDCVIGSITGDVEGSCGKAPEEDPRCVCWAGEWYEENNDDCEGGGGPIEP